MNNFLRGINLHHFQNKVMELILSGKNEIAIEFIKDELKFETYIEAKNYGDQIFKNYFKMNKNH